MSIGELGIHPKPDKTSSLEYLMLYQDFESLKEEYKKLLKTADDIIHKLSNLAPHTDENLDVFAVWALGYGRRRTDP